ncbi:TlpA family protein disulfide reductase [Zobellia alginiliquefaciens]|uniref:TlpA family protein disulfide reductase n=1 Tax=Zobellia alginiliquefaciens TaxID=3032586 RepID=UPI0023E3E7AB|nr:TlpA disulfide reductase family protein [Zobellia alginiliquefaciens]
MKKRKLSISDGVLLVFILLLVIPQTRKPIQVALNSVKMQFFSPSKISEENQTVIEPFNYRVETLNGENISLEIGKGRVTFIGYWATWCPPCIAEMPSIQKLYDDYGESVNFILLTNEAPETVRSFLDKKDFDLPVYIPKMQAPKKLYETSIPTNYIIDKKGKMSVKETGATDWNAEKIRQILNELISS